jgi:hypothetical protein
MEWKGEAETDVAPSNVSCMWANQKGLFFASFFNYSVSFVL